MTNIRYGGGAVVADHQDGGHLLSLDKFGSFEFLVKELTPRLRSHVGVVLTAVESIIGKVPVDGALAGRRGTPRSASLYVTLAG